MRNSASHNGARDSIETEKKIVSVLFDWGPHTISDISESLKISEPYVGVRLQHLCEEGSVEKMRRGNKKYFLVP